MGTVSKLALFLIALLVLIAAFYSSFSLWSAGQQAKVCRQSALASSWAGSPDVLRCPPQYLTIKDSEEIRGTISDQMVECFWKFGANEYDLFSGSAWSEKRFCALCAHLKFEGDARGKKIGDLDKHLSEQKVRKKYLPKNMESATVAEYIIGEPTTEGTVRKIGSQGLSIDTSHDYGIVYVYTKDEHIGKAWSTLIGFGAGTAIGVAGGVLLMSATPAGLGVLVLVTKLSGLAGAGAGFAAGSERGADWQSAVMLIPWDSAAIQSLNCSMMPVPQQNK